MPAQIAMISGIRWTTCEKGVIGRRIYLWKKVTENGDVKKEKSSVLNKWKTDFENAHNVANEEEIYCDYDTSSNINTRKSEILNEGILIMDVKQAVLFLNKTIVEPTDFMRKCYAQIRALIFSEYCLCVL